MYVLHGAHATVSHALIVQSSSYAHKQPNEKEIEKMEWTHIFTWLWVCVCFISSWKMRVIYLVIKYTWGKLAVWVCL